MSRFDEPAVGADPDPVESDDPSVLRAEILRLRDALLAGRGRTEVLRDRIAELESHEAALAADNARLLEELGRNPVMRVARAAARRLPGRS